MFIFLLKKYIWAKLGLFFPVRVVTKLTPIPENGLVAFIKANAEISGLTESLPLYLNVIMAVAYGVLFYWMSHMIMQRRDL